MPGWNAITLLTINVTARSQIPCYQNFLFNYIQYNNHVKLLGITLDIKLKRCINIESFYKKLSTQLFVLKRLRLRFWCSEKALLSSKNETFPGTLSIK